MSRNYLGHLSECDPLHGYLQRDIQPQITGAPGNSTYRVFGLNGSNDVYLYEDRHTGSKVIGKFFRTSRKNNAAKADLRLTREFDNLCTMRSYGLMGYQHHVVKPLGRRKRCCSGPAPCTGSDFCSVRWRTAGGTLHGYPLPKIGYGA